MLAPHYDPTKIEAGCDEAGRGCLAGPVVAAAVVLPHDYSNPLLNDSKKLTERQRKLLRPQIEQAALSFAVYMVAPEEIDRLNILRATFHAMNMAVAQLAVRPDLLLIDGNRFINESSVPFVCIVKGDAQLQPIAAASILAKTYRDEYMEAQHLQYPHYGWDRNKGYPTPAHYAAIEQYGITPLHRKSYKLDRQLALPLSS